MARISVPQVNELALFTFRSHPRESGFYAPTQIEDVEYLPFRTADRDGLLWRSQDLWLMVEAARKIEPGGYINGERRRLLMARAGFAPDPETGRLVPQGPLAAEYRDDEDLPSNVAFIVTEAAKRYDLLVNEDVA